MTVRDGNSAFVVGSNLLLSYKQYVVNCYIIVGGGTARGSCFLYKFNFVGNVLVTDPSSCRCCQLQYLCNRKVDDYFCVGWLCVYFVTLRITAFVSHSFVRVVPVACVAKVWQRALNIALICSLVIHIFVYRAAKGVLAVCLVVGKFSP